MAIRGWPTILRFLSLLWFERGLREKVGLGSWSVAVAVVRGQHGKSGVRLPKLIINQFSKPQSVSTWIIYVKLSETPSLIDRPLMDGGIRIIWNSQPAIDIFLKKFIYFLHLDINGDAKKALEDRNLDLSATVEQINNAIVDAVAFRQDKVQDVSIKLDRFPHIPSPWPAKFTIGGARQVNLPESRYWQ